MKTYIYFRNDDVNTLDKELINVTELLITEGVPITHAVEPANVKDDTVAWLNEMKAENPNLIEIMQHGFDHKRRHLGEFGGSRPYEEQLEYISKGKQIMLESFGENFVKAINFPFGNYNKHTIKAADELGFKIISSHYNYKPSRRIMYYLGNLARRGQIFGKHVSHHMQYYPATNLFEIDMCLSFIKKYIGGYNSRECVFEDINDMLEEYQHFKKHTNVIGILLHHRYHHSRKGVELIRDTIKALKTEDVVFTNYSELYRTFSG